MYVVGNLPELGAWNHNQAIQLHQEHTYTTNPTIPLETNYNDETFNGNDDSASNNLFDQENE